MVAINVGAHNNPFAHYEVIRFDVHAHVHSIKRNFPGLLFGHCPWKLCLWQDRETIHNHHSNALNLVLYPICLFTNPVIPYLKNRCAIELFDFLLAILLYAT